MSRTYRRGWDFLLAQPCSPLWDWLPRISNRHRDHDCHQCHFIRQDKIRERRRARRVARQETNNRDNWN